MNKKLDYGSLLGENNPLDRFPLLYEAALGEFSQKTFDDASLNDLLRKANMSKGSLYHHFGDKFGLYLALLDKIGQKKLAFFMPLLRQGVDFSDFFETIKALSQKTMAFMFQDERMYQFTNRILEEEPGWISRLLPYLNYDFGQGFGPLIDSAIKTGQIDGRYPPEFVKRALNLLFSNLHKLTDSRSPEEMYHYLTLAVDMMKTGLAAKEEQTP